VRNRKKKDKKKSRSNKEGCVFDRRNKTIKSKSEEGRVFDRRSMK
jgi:hypothetical protein